MAVGAALALTACSPSPAPPTGQAAREARTHLVEVAAAVRGPVERVSVHTGTLKARRLLRVFTQEEGRIITALPFFEGDRVRKGDLVLRLDEALLKAQLDKAVASRQQADIDLKRLQGLTGRQLVSEDEIARARTAVEIARAEESALQTRLGYAVERAPFDAVVSARLAEPGDVVARQTHVLTLTDPASLVTEVAVSELVIPYLRVGDPAEVRIDALGTTALPGRILRIHPALDARQRRGLVEVALDPVPPGAQPGQFARVTLRVDEGERLRVPFAALQRDRDRELVFRIGEDGRVDRTGVRSGARHGNTVEILEGLSPGDTVVTRGFLGLRDGLKVQVVPPVSDRSG
ncbi:MAG: efflux RND transporter periplasmic adaptor subunit [Gammaproteobacteria bacterium]|nr:efflux RND transporter periplasmic adaptor subunit [Gammaproteobacteria bacterium]